MNNKFLQEELNSLKETNNFRVLKECDSSLMIIWD